MILAYKKYKNRIKSVNDELSKTITKVKACVEYLKICAKGTTLEVEVLYEMNSEGISSGSKDCI